MYADKTIVTPSSSPGIVMPSLVTTLKETMSEQELGDYRSGMAD
jgi:hypothetical protein